MDPQQIVAWAAPIAATLVTAAGQLALNSRFKQADERRELARAETTEKREREAEWCRRIESDIAEQGKNIDHLMTLHATSMRSDLIHRAHRYIDDLGCASIEEKQAFHEQWKQYCVLCEKMGIKNEFIDGLVEQVKNLPNRPTKEETK